jgi:hypothetical protein
MDMCLQRPGEKRQAAALLLLISAGSGHGLRGAALLDRGMAASAGGVDSNPGNSERSRGLGYR